MHGMLLIYEKPGAIIRLAAAQKVT